MFSAIFIDFENLEKTLKKDHGSILLYEEFAELLKSIGKKHGQLTTITAYGDFDKVGEGGKQTKLMKLGITPKHVVTKTPHEYLKGSTDIELSLDVLDTMYLYTHITEYIFVSGDSDLRHIISRLRLNGKRITIVGYDNYTSSYLKENADHFYSLDNHQEISRKVSSSDKEKLLQQIINDEYVEKVIQFLNISENDDKDFVGLNFLRKKLEERYPKTEIGDALTACIDSGIIITYQVENPNSPKHSTTACKLDRSIKIINDILER